MNDLAPLSELEHALFQAGISICRPVPNTKGGPGKPRPVEVIRSTPRERKRRQEAAERAAKINSGQIKETLINFEKTPTGSSERDYVEFWKLMGWGAFNFKHNRHGWKTKKQPPELEFGDVTDWTRATPSLEMKSIFFPGGVSKTRGHEETDFFEMAPETEEIRLVKKTPRWHKEPSGEGETVEQYLARGGKITVVTEHRVMDIPYIPNRTDRKPPTKIYVDEPEPKS